MNLIKNIIPRWESKKFPAKQTETLFLLASGYAEDKGDALFINQEARIYGGKIAKGAVIKHAINHQAYVLASNGLLKIEDYMQGKADIITMNKGDGAEVTQSKFIWLKAITDCEIIIIDTIN